MASWVSDTTMRVGAEIKRLRGKRSAQWLSDRTSELGYHVPRTTISETENGRRKGALPVQEVIVLAMALEVPPVQILFPGLPSAPTEYAPGFKVRAIDAARMFSGEMPQPQTGDDSIDVMAMSREWAQATAGVGAGTLALVDARTLSDLPKEVIDELRTSAKDVDLVQRSMRQATYPFYWGVPADQMDSETSEDYG
ncbi:hypothetical protein ACIGKQ_16400 [Gordonia sp. NPDC062954]|uniref:hypothetical protein n=1 Tax=Gordonia sp. NPDC062954 TaxID=3364003 RepID=UPI0037C89159